MLFLGFISGKRIRFPGEWAKTLKNQGSLTSTQCWAWAHPQLYPQTCLSKEREARWKEENFPSTFLLCSSQLQNNIQIPLKSVHILHKDDIHEASDVENSPQRPQSGPRVPSKWLQCAQSDLRVPSKWLQVLPKRTQVLSSGPPRPPQTPQNRSKKESKTTPGHL